MNTDENGLSDALTETVIGAVFEVSHTLGAGFLEKVYERALLTELRLRGIRVEAQVRFPVVYKGSPAGDYFADVLVERRLILEIKCVERLGPDQQAQCLNYLRASGLRFGLLVNFFRPKVEWKRVVLGY
jgi:GxxExxY protein